MSEASKARSNDLGELQDVLFDEIRRLAGVDRSKPEALEREVAVAQAVSSLAGTAIENANTALRVVQVGQQLRGTEKAMPRMLGGKS